MESEAPYGEEVWIEHRPHNQFLDKALRIVLAGDVLPLYARPLVQDFVADQLQDVGVQLLQRLWQLPIRPCTPVAASDLGRSLKKKLLLFHILGIRQNGLRPLLLVGQRTDGWG